MYLPMIYIQYTQICSNLERAPNDIKKEPLRVGVLLSQARVVS